MASYDTDVQAYSYSTNVKMVKKESKPYYRMCAITVVLRLPKNLYSIKSSSFSGLCSHVSYGFYVTMDE